jgi:hypothetical protein
VNIPDLITAAQKDLLQTTITGKAWAKKRGPGKWRDASSPDVLRVEFDSVRVWQK